MRPLVTSHLKLRHDSGGRAQPLLGLLEASPAPFGVVAVADVVGHGEREVVPVEVVDVLDDELADGAEMALDPVQVFNYFPTKEDPFYSGLETFEAELVEAVRNRPSGESALSAFCRFVLDGTKRLAGEEVAPR